jgi:hypothetical protein
MIRFIPQAPTEVTFTPDSDDVASRLSPRDVEELAEAFKPPLHGAYVWTYEEVDSRIRKLYRLGKERNWNADYDVDWNQRYPKSSSPMIEGGENPFAGWEPFEALSDAKKTEFGWHSHAWTLSQFLHGEQGALLVSSQLVSCAPTYDAKLYASSQAFDEARHVEVFGRYLHDKVGITYPVNKHLKALIDKVLTDERWDLKFIGMQLVIESLALAAFHVQRAMAADPLLRSIIDLVVRDEARHVAFGVNYMEQFVKALPENEREDHWGMDVEEGRRRFLAAGQLDMFRNLLFTRIMPNLQKVGLITEAVKPQYEALGLLQFAALPNDGDIDWAQLEAPLPTYPAVAAAAAE